MDDVSCQQCRFWHLLSSEGQGSGKYECRRFPPLPRLNSKGDPITGVVFPFTKADDWCGEFENITELQPELVQVPGVRGTNLELKPGSQFESAGDEFH